MLDDSQITKSYIKLCYLDGNDITILPLLIGHNKLQLERVIGTGERETMYIHGQMAGF